MYTSLLLFDNLYAKFFRFPDDGGENLRQFFIGGNRFRTSRQADRERFVLFRRTADAAHEIGNGIRMLRINADGGSPVRARSRRSDRLKHLVISRKRTVAVGAKIVAAIDESAGVALREENAKFTAVFLRNVTS